MKTGYLLLVFLLLFSLAIQAQQKSVVYKQRIQLIQENIARYFYDSATGYYKEFDKRDSSDKKEYSYLWPICALIQAANETEAVGLSSPGVSEVLRAVYAYEDKSAPAPAYASYISRIEKDDRFYDDNQWVGIACMDAYERTAKPEYLAEGYKVYRFMMTGFDTISGGGLYWKEHDPSTKNTCSNGPGILVALQLYKATKNKAFLDTALLLYNWTNKYLLSPEGVYYDHVKLPSLGIDKRTYTYNTGTMLESNVLLYEITGERKFLEQAKQLALGGYRQFYKNNKLPGNSWFNAVLLRGYLALYRHDKNRQYVDAFITDTENRWQNQRDQNGLFGRKAGKKELIEQAAQLEIYARLLTVE